MVSHQSVLMVPPPAPGSVPVVHLPNSPNFVETYDALLKRPRLGLILASSVCTVSANLRASYNRGTCQYHQHMVSVQSASISMDQIQRLRAQSAQLEGEA